MDTTALTPVLAARRGGILIMRRGTSAAQARALAPGRNVPCAARDERDELSVAADGTVVLREWAEYRVESLEDAFTESDFNKRGRFVDERVGLLRFENCMGCAAFCGVPLFVLSKKISPAQYDEMTRIVDAGVAGLSCSFERPSRAPAVRDPRRRTGVDYHKLLLVLKWLSTPRHSENLLSLAEHVARDLCRMPICEDADAPLHAVSSLDGAVFAEILSRPELLRPTAANLPLSRRLTDRSGGRYLPERVAVTETRDSIDTPENRYIKVFLQRCADLLARFDTHFQTHRTHLVNRPLAAATMRGRERLAGLLARAPWPEIGRMTRVPFGSTALRGREGYRQLFGYSLLLDALPVPLLSEDDLRDAIEQKEIDRLYELFCFFTVLDAVRECYCVDVAELPRHFRDDLFERRLSHSDKGRAFLFEGTGLPRVAVCYNRTYRGSRSVSHPFRPDISIEVLDGARTGRILILDAKFRAQTRLGKSVFQQDDIDKMHAYRDAVKHTVGAFALYPGELRRFYPPTPARWRRSAGFRCARAIPRSATIWRDACGIFCRFERILAICAGICYHIEYQLNIA